MEKRIKFVIRRNLPETNSSSSHSVVIESGNYIPSEHNFTVIDGYIVIPSTQMFERGGYGKFNDPLTKTQYACGQIYGYNKTEYFKRLKIIEEIIKEVTGCKGVIFEWVISYFKTLLNTEKETLDDFDEGYFYEDEGPNIDHQSLDLEKEVLENKEVTKSFIFNPKSWLFLCDDEHSVEIDFYNTTEYHDFDPDAHLMIEFDEPLGTIEIPIKEFPEDLMYDSYYSDDKRKILSCVSFDSSTGNLK